MTFAWTLSFSSTESNLPSGSLNASRIFAHLGSITEKFIISLGVVSLSTRLSAKQHYSFQHETWKRQMGQVHPQFVAKSHHGLRGPQ